MAAPFAAPQTPFNASITAHRNVAFAELDFEDIKTVKNHFGVKVNDVVMALVSGVLRQFLIDRGELPDSSLVAMVPVSVHDRSDRPGRNQVSGMFSRLETQIDDPAERLEAIAEANDAAKEHSTAIGATLLQDWSQFAGPAVFGVAMRVYARSRLTESRPVHNLVVSNVPGPQIPLYFLGAEVASMYPLGPIFHGSGLNITVMSLNGKARRRADLVPGAVARPVGHGRRFRRRDEGTAGGLPLSRHTGARSLRRSPSPTMAACWP